MDQLQKPLRQNVALAVDGGGIRGVMVARALTYLERATGKKIPELFGLAAGTSTGAIIAAGVARGMEADSILKVYTELGPAIFPKSWRTLPLTRYLVSYRYDSAPLIKLMAERLGDITLGELHSQKPDFNMVITATDVLANATRFIKLYKDRYADWRLRDAVMASSVVPTVFPVYEHDYRKMPDDPPEESWLPLKRFWLDGGVGSYSNPSYMAAYEIAFCLGARGWRLDNTTLISIGTGIDPLQEMWDERLRGLFGKRSPRDFLGPEWVLPVVDTFLHDAASQQVKLVRHFFTHAPADRAGDPQAGLDFRRFNVAFEHPIDMTETSAIPQLIKYGDQLGEMILNDAQEDVGDFGCAETGVPVPQKGL